MSARTRSLTLTGLLTGFIVLCLYAASIVPTGRAGFLVLASFLVGSVLLLSGWRWALGGLVASLLLAFWMLPDKLGLLPFALLFGPYPLLKNAVERLNRLWLEWVIKLVGFGLLLFLGLSLFSPLLPAILRTGLAPAILIAFLFIGFVVYDWLFTQWVHFFLHRIVPRFRNVSR